MKALLRIGLVTLTCAAPCYAQTPAFPGAQGGGAGSVGGRGGSVCEVTNLNDSGPNSLRDCVTRSGPRTVVFRVSGVIQLTSGGIRIFQPYLTVAGQSAPGGGIEISGRNIGENVILVYTHDVIWRYTRIRKGYNPASRPGSQVGTIVYIANGSYNVVFDHNSFSWSQDECMNPWTNERSVAESPATHNVTLSWNLAAEGLKGHSTGLLIGANPGSSFAAQMNEIDAHHNLMMNFDHRLPLVQGTPNIRYINNVTYNWAYYAGQWLGDGSWDIIGNLFKPGPMTRGLTAHEIQLSEKGAPDQCCAPPSAYIAGNKGPHLSDPAADNWTMVARVAGENGGETGPAPVNWRRSAPLPAQKFPILTDDVNRLEGVLLPTVGASQRLDCSGNWVVNRDSVDLRLIGEYFNGQGRQPVTEDEVGGFPVISATQPCADSDHDGIPDAWEIAHGLNPKDSSHANKLNPGGYTNLEHYLNGPVRTEDFSQPKRKLSSNWGVSTRSLRVRGPAGPGQRQTWTYWKADTFATDQYSQVVVAPESVEANPEGIGVTVRCSTSGAPMCYRYIAFPDARLLQKVVGGTVTNLASVSSPTPAIHVLRLEIFGTTLTASLNGATDLTAQDSAIASGAPGITGLEFLNQGASDFRVSKWEGGSLNAGTAALGMIPAAGQLRDETTLESQATVMHHLRERLSLSARWAAAGLRDARPHVYWLLSILLLLFRRPLGRLLSRPWRRRRSGAAGSRLKSRAGSGEASLLSTRENRP
ncbi:MAG: hypothetical protein HY237_02765 [Acidobacteria bacterium]|nr:hypothetical protein [Acidobacteriota bacterium]